MPLLSVTIHLCTPDGGIIDRGEIDVETVSGRRAFAGSILDGAILHLEPGQYIVSFAASNFKGSTSRINVDQEREVIVVGGEFALMDSPEVLAKISVNVSLPLSCSEGGYLWAKLVGVFQPTSKAVLVNKAGFALFDNLGHGKYIIAIVDGEAIRAVKSVSARGPATDVRLTLSDCGGSDKRE